MLVYSLLFLLIAILCYLVLLVSEQARKVEDVAVVFTLAGLVCSVAGILGLMFLMARTIWEGR